MRPEYFGGDYRGGVLRGGEKRGGELTYVSPDGIFSPCPTPVGQGNLTLWASGSLPKE